MLADARPLDLRRLAVQLARRAKPDQLLRVSIALAFLKHAYSILRGRDLETRATTVERRYEQFQRLQESQAKVLDLTNWHEYLRCLERMRYRGSKMMPSQSVVRSSTPSV